MKEGTAKPTSNSVFIFHTPFILFHPRVDVLPPVLSLKDMCCSLIDRKNINFMTKKLPKDLQQYISRYSSPTSLLFPVLFSLLSSPLPSPLLLTIFQTFGDKISTLGDQRTLLPPSDSQNGPSCYLKYEKRGIGRWGERMEKGKEDRREGGRWGV